MDPVSRGFTGRVRTLAARLADRWQRIEARRAPLARVWPARFVLLTVLGLTLLGLQFLVCQRDVEEDGVISLRFARNLASGHGFTFNPGERGVEGVSNILWVFLLALAHPLGPGLQAVAQLVGMLLAAANLVVVTWMACRFGAFAWIPVLLLGASVSVAGSACTGMETALVSLLYTLAAVLWATEEVRRPFDMVPTALACWLISMSRPEGVAVFVIISLFRVLSARGGELRPLVRYWLVPFGLPFTAYTLWRVWTFGSLVPHVYFSRVLPANGAFPESLGLGIRYLVEQMTLVNPAWALTLVALPWCWRRCETARLGALVVGHLGLVAAVGGDPSGLLHSRFVVPVVGLLGFLTQCWVQDLSGSRGRLLVVPTLLAALLTAGSCWTIEEPRVPGATFQRTPFGRLLSQTPEATRQDLARGRLWLEWRWAAAGEPSREMLYFDGIVARHLAETWGTDLELSALNAGLMAYNWPGTFRDYYGLPTRRPLLPWRDDPQPRLFLINPQLFESEIRPLLEGGYRLACVYVHGRNYWNLGPLPWLLLARPPIGVEPVSRDSYDAGGKDFLWWRLPRERIVLIEDISSKAGFEFQPRTPAFDGPNRTIDEPDLSLLPPPLQDWVRNPGVPLAGGPRGAGVEPK